MTAISPPALRPVHRRVRRWIRRSRTASLLIGATAAALIFAAAAWVFYDWYAVTTLVKASPSYLFALILLASMAGQGARPVRRRRRR